MLWYNKNKSCRARKKQSIKSSSFFPKVLEDKSVKCMEGGDLKKIAKESVTSGSHPV